MLLDRQVEGMIFVSCEMTNLSGEHDHYGRLLSEGARIVFVNGALTLTRGPSAFSSSSLRSLGAKGTPSAAANSLSSAAYQYPLSN